MFSEDFEERCLRLLSGKVFDERFVMPDYGNLNIVNLYSIVGKIFDVNSLLPVKMSVEGVSGFSNVSKVVLFIVDGLGYNFMRSRLKGQRSLLPSARDGYLIPITSTFPSTTSTALTSFFTATAPIGHGVVGYTMYLKSFGLVIDMLNFTPVYGWMSNENIMQELPLEKDLWPTKLSEAGVDVRIFTRFTTIDSGLSKILYRGQKTVAYTLATDLFVNLKKTLESSGQALIIAYYPGYDTLSHLYGPFSEEAETELAFFESLFKTFLFERLDRRVRDETLFLLTSDHGQSHTENVLFLKDMPKILAHLIVPPAGDSRATFLFAKQGKAEALKALLQEELKGFKVYDSVKMVENGFFGAIENGEDRARLEERVGDLTAVAVEKNALLYPYSEKDRERSKRGSHGGLSLDEMLVPLAALKF